MDETELIISLQDRISSAVSPSVETSDGGNDRTVPVVIIDDWDTRDMNHNNTSKAGSALGDFDNDGSTEYEWYLNFSFETRVEFLVRHTDEVEVSRLKEKVKQELRLIRENPEDFHSDLKFCSLGADGSPRNKFTSPTESELMVSAKFRGDHTITRRPSDVDADQITSITDSFTFNPQ